MKTSNRGFWMQLLLGRKTSMIREMEYEHLKGISYREIMSTWQSGDCIKKDNTHDCLLSIGCYSIHQYADVISCIPHTYSIKVGIVIIFIWCLWPGAYPQLLLSLSTFSKGFIVFMWDWDSSTPFYLPDLASWEPDPLGLQWISEGLQTKQLIASTLGTTNIIVLQWIQTW